MKINDIILVLRTRIILLSPFVIYFFCICHSGCFPIVHIAGEQGAERLPGRTPVCLRTNHEQIQRANLQAHDGK